MKRSMALALVVVALAVMPCCKKNQAAAKPDPVLKAYDVEKDWNDPDKLIPLDYQEAQGKRIFYAKCVWCHADTTPAGPSNRSNLNPTPPLMNDGAALNSMSDETLGTAITLGGEAMGKSAMMPPWGKTLTQDEIRSLVAYIRAVAQPAYHRPAQAQPKYSTR